MKPALLILVLVSGVFCLSVQVQAINDNGSIVNQHLACSRGITKTNRPDDESVELPATPTPPECGSPGGILVWDQPVDCDTGTGYSSQYDTSYPFESRTADDFLFSTAPANGIRFVTWCGNYWAGYPGAPTTAFNIYIYNNVPTPCAPTTPESSYIAMWTIDIADCHEVSDCTGNPYANVFKYCVELSPKFYPADGTHYWISIQAVEDFPPQWGWFTSTLSTSLCDPMQGFPLAGIPYWTELTGAPDMAYRLYEDIVIPTNTPYTGPTSTPAPIPAASPGGIGIIVLIFSVMLGGYALFLKNR